MIKSGLQKVLLSIAVMTTSLVAGDIDHSSTTNSLFAVEAGYSSADVESISGTGTSKENFANIGLKIGAEGESYRVFLGGSSYLVPDYSYMYMYGAAAQYKFNFMKKANFFIGANVGFADLKATAATDNTNTSYYGGDAGFNFHATKVVDLELGMRAVKLVDVDNMLTGYMSVIIKYQMD